MAGQGIPFLNPFDTIAYEEQEIVAIEWRKVDGLMGRQSPGFDKKIVLLVVVVLLAFILSEVAARIEGIDTLDYLYVDFWHILAGVRAETRHVAMVIIDNETLLHFRDEPLVFWGPHFAQGIEVLQKAGVKVIGLDYFFTVSAESWFKKMEVSGSDQSRTYDIPMRRQLATGKVVLIGWAATNDKGEVELLLPTEDYLFALSNGRADVGLANFSPDEDGIIRRFVPVLFDDGTIPSLTFATLLAVKARHLEPSAQSWSLGGREVPRRAIPHAIDFAGPPGTFPRLSFLRLLQPMAEKDPEIEQLKDKVVIIASEHLGMQDIHLVPYSRGLWKMEEKMMSGAELHANIVETLLSGRSLQPVPNWMKILYTIGILAIGTFLFFKLHPLRGLIVGLLLSLFCAVFAYLLFHIRWILPVFGLQMGLALSYLGTLGLRLTKEERERKELRRMFGRYVSDEVVEKLIAMGHRPDLGGEALQVTVLFADIRNFTTISERLKPHQVVEMLNVFLGRACEAIQRYDGTVDKFIGDAIMAVFGSPVTHPDHAQRAIRAALALRDTAQEFRSWMDQRFADVALPLFEIGIGIHTGEAVIGSIGSPKRMEFTAIGDVVNTASRLEGLTKELGWTIVASQATLHSAGPVVLTGKQRKVMLKGREEEIEVIEVIGLAREKGGDR